MTRKFDFQIPVINSVGELAEWLEITPHELKWLCNHVRSDCHVGNHSKHYVNRWMRKRTVGWRLIESPKPRLKAVQRKILHQILNHVPPHPLSCGFCVGRSIKDYVKPHIGRHIILKLDLKNFFTHVTTGRAGGLFRSLGYRRDVSHQLAMLTTVRTSEENFGFAAPGLPNANAVPATYKRKLRTRHLPQGAPTSPAIANLCAFGLDQRLSGLARSIGGVHYTRYADDLLFSGYRSFCRHAKTLNVVVGTIAIEEGFDLNFQKTRIARSSQRQKAGGVVLNAHANLQRSEYDKLKAIIHNCTRFGCESQNRDDHPHFREHVAGRIAWLELLNPAKGAKLREKFESIK